MTDAINSKVIDRIRKLMSLANNNANLNESAAAFAQAQTLLSKHRLTMAEVDVAKAAFEGGEQVIKSARPLYVGERVVHWKSFLANNISSLNGCKMFVDFRNVCSDCRAPLVKKDKKWVCSSCNVYLGYKKEAAYVVVGRPSDIEIVDYLFHSIAGQIDILCKNYMLTGHGTGKTFSNNFRLGAVDTVCDRLKVADEQVKQEYKGSAAMVLVERREAEVAEWVQTNVGKLKNINTSSVYDRSARDLGREAGHRVSLNKGMGGAGSGGGLLK